MEDVLDVYQRPVNPKRPLICLDEASKQLLAEVRAPLPAAPGQVARQDCGYHREGTAALFMAFEPLAGQRHVFVRAQRTRRDFAQVIQTLCDRLHPRAEKIVLVLDQLNTHGEASLYAAFPPQEARRLAERMQSRAHLEAEVTAWQLARNAAATRASWRFSTTDARVKLKHLYPTVLPG